MIQFQEKGFTQANTERCTLSVEVVGYAMSYGYDRDKLRITAEVKKESVVPCLSKRERTSFRFFSPQNKTLLQQVKCRLEK